MSARKLAEQEKNLADLKSELEETKKATPSDEVGKVVIQEIIEWKDTNLETPSGLDPFLSQNKFNTKKPTPVCTIL